MVLVRESKTWALVDVLAGDVIGELLVRDPSAASRLDLWALDDDFWVRRAALLAMIEPLRNGAGFDRFAGYGDGMLDEREFFIRKAIGWVLRETGKQRPDEVYGWLAPRTDHGLRGKAPGTSIGGEPADGRISDPSRLLLT